VNSGTGKSYEEELCSGTPHLGVVAVGDSAGAHFQIPPKYMNASLIDEHTYDNLLYNLADEMDLPHLGGYTGFYDGSPGVMVDSIYKRMVERNRCVHRDYQNICVNGNPRHPSSSLRSSFIVFLLCLCVRVCVGCWNRHEIRTIVKVVGYGCS
jgi:hypothetical protein